MDEEKTYLGHKKRIREKFVLNGCNGMLDYEILELLLSFIVKNDTKPVAKRLIEKFHSIDKVLVSDIKTLCEVEGVTERTAIFLKLIGSLPSYSFDDKIKKENIRLDLDSDDDSHIRTKSQLIKYLKNNIGLSKDEQFKVLFLDTSNKILSFETLFTGTIDKSAIYPRKILERVLFHNARSIVFAHNHPSGNITPSQKDIELTRAMEDFFKMVDVNIIDHIIIGKDSYLSFLEEGII